MTPVFLDVNIPMYAAGEDHPLRRPCARVLELVAESPEAFWTNAEIFQEILHRYRSLDVWAKGRQVFDTFADLMDDNIEPITFEDVLRAASLALDYPRLGARDLLHAASVTGRGRTLLLSTDRGFDTIDSLERIDPRDLPAIEKAIR
jgi:uncharacterized protein